MSTFEGLMKEYRRISIDRFDGINLDSTAYFLSHNHKDHTVGLDSTAFQYRLNNNLSYKLYCSVVTSKLLLLGQHYQSIKKSIVALEVDRPYVLLIPNAEGSKTEDEKVTVTLLQAGHCPGSVMFLFDGQEGTVLYTGDFRLSKQDIASFTSLKGDLDIQSMYVDTTFVVPEAAYIPSREESTDAAIELVRDWITRSPNHVVLLKTKADIGYENLFVRISQHFSMKIHVSDRKYQQCLCLEDASNYVTLDASVTQIHACKLSRQRSQQQNNKKSKSHHDAAKWCGGSLPCGFTSADKTASLQIRTLLFSTMFFIQQFGFDAYTKRINEHFQRVCYSFHSSYSEVRELILQLRPARAFPNVIPAYEHTGSTMQDRLDEFVKLARSISRPTSTNILMSDSNATGEEFRSLGRLKMAKKRLLRTDSSDENGFKASATNRVYSTKKKKHDDPVKREENQFNLLFGGSESSAEQPCIFERPSDAADSVADCCDFAYSAVDTTHDMTVSSSSSCCTSVSDSSDDCDDDDNALLGVNCLKGIVISNDDDNKTVWLGCQAPVLARYASHTNAVSDECHDNAVANFNTCTDSQVGFNVTSNSDDLAANIKRTSSSLIKDVMICEKTSTVDNSQPRILNSKLVDSGASKCMAVSKNLHVVGACAKQFQLLKEKIEAAAVVKGDVLSLQQDKVCDVTLLTEYRSASDTDVIEILDSQEDKRVKSEDLVIIDVDANDSDDVFSVPQSPYSKVNCISVKSTNLTSASTVASTTTTITATAATGPPAAATCSDVLTKKYTSPTVNSSDIRISKTLEGVTFNSTEDKEDIVSIGSHDDEPLSQASDATTVDIGCSPIKLINCSSSLEDLVTCSPMCSPVKLIHVLNNVEGCLDNSSQISLSLSSSNEIISNSPISNENKPHTSLTLAPHDLLNGAVKNNTTSVRLRFCSEKLVASLQNISRTDSMNEALKHYAEMVEVSTGSDNIDACNSRHLLPKQQSEQTPSNIDCCLFPSEPALAIYDGDVSYSSDINSSYKLAKIAVIVNGSDSDSLFSDSSQ